MQFTIADNPHAAPHRPHIRAGVARDFNAYSTDTPAGRVTVQAWPFRGMTSVRQIARRIHSDPEPYLWAVSTFDVPGIQITAAAAPAFTLRIAAA